MLPLIAACHFTPAAAGLKSLQAYIDSNTPSASACARAAGLFLEAHELIQRGNEWQAAARRLSEKYSPRAADERQKQELARLVINVSQSASGLTRLQLENAGLAYLEMCRQRALGVEPKEQQEAILRTRIAAAEACQTRHTPGARQKDCVVGAFEPRDVKRAEPRKAKRSESRKAKWSETRKAKR